MLTIFGLKGWCSYAKHVMEPCTPSNFSLAQGWEADLKAFNQISHVPLEHACSQCFACFELTPGVVSKKRENVSHVSHKLFHTALAVRPWLMSGFQVGCRVRVLRGRQFSDFKESGSNDIFLGGLNSNRFDSQGECSG